MIGILSINLHTLDIDDLRTTAATLDLSELLDRAIDQAIAES